MEQPFRDYLTRKEIGIRIKGQKTCRVIRVFKGEWIEFGPEYTLPMPPELLQWSPPGIPASTLAVALKIYEMDNLWSGLRGLLSGEAESADGRAGDGVGRKLDGLRKSKEAGSSVPGRPRKPGTFFKAPQKRTFRPV
jgi:hypothetical protein